MVNHDDVLLCYRLSLTAYIFFHAGSVLYVFVSRDYESNFKLVAYRVGKIRSVQIWYGSW